MTAFQASVRSTARSTLAPELFQTQHLDLPLHPQQSVEGKNVHTTSQHWSTPAHLFDSVNPSSLKTKKIKWSSVSLLKQGVTQVAFSNQKKKSILAQLCTAVHTHTQKKIWNRVDCKRSEKRSKTHKRLKERFLIRQNRTKRANFRCNHLFRATYNTTENS